jgi:hypothetical protein
VRHIIKNIFDWSEVWALLIPLTVLFLKKRQPAFNKPVIIYIWIALLLNTGIDLTWKLRLSLPVAFQSNNYLYNIHSVVRLLLFSLFFIELKQPFLVKVKKAIPFLFIGFVIVNFCFYQNFFDYWQLSSRLLSIEAALLLFYCIQYYLFKIKEDEEVNKAHPDFWIVTGLGIYVTANFVIFLLYNELTRRLQNFAISLWNIHNITYIILNVFIAKGFYESNE